MSYSIVNPTRHPRGLTPQPSWSDFSRFLSSEDRSKDFAGKSKYIILSLSKAISAIDYWKINRSTSIWNQNNVGARPLCEGPQILGLITTRAQGWFNGFFGWLAKKCLITTRKLCYGSYGMLLVLFAVLHYEYLLLWVLLEILKLSEAIADGRNSAVWKLETLSIVG